MCCSPHTAKGGNISLSDRAQAVGTKGLLGLRLGLGWSPRPQKSGDAFDLDASAIGLGPDGKIISAECTRTSAATTTPTGCIFIYIVISPPSLNQPAQGSQ